MEEARQFMETQVTAGPPATPKNMIRRTSSAKTLHTNSSSRSRSSRKQKEAEPAAQETQTQPSPRTKATAAKTKAKPKQVAKAKSKPKGGKGKTVRKSTLKKKKQMSGRSEVVTSKDETKEKAAKEDSKGSDGAKAKAKVVPRSPRTIKAAKAVISCLKRADTTDIGKGSAKKAKVAADAGHGKKEKAKEIKEKDPDEEAEETSEDEDNSSEAASNEKGSTRTIYAILQIPEASLGFK